MSKNRIVYNPLKRAISSAAMERKKLLKGDGNNMRDAKKER